MARAHYYAERVSDDFVSLAISAAELKAIEGVLSSLSSGELQGYPVSVEVATAEHPVFQYAVGRFKLNYTISRKYLEVNSIMA